MDDEHVDLGCHTWHPLMSFHLPKVSFAKHTFLDVVTT